MVYFLLITIACAEHVLLQCLATVLGRARSSLSHELCHVCSIGGCHCASQVAELCQDFNSSQDTELVFELEFGTWCCSHGRVCFT